MADTPERQLMLGFRDLRVRLKLAELSNSRASVDRHMKRPAQDNPLPRPLRNSITGWRYWPKADVEGWIAAERRRIGVPLTADPIVTDDDPQRGRWRPGIVAA
jgi:predicted DNA-binding transcriptional regulator AlpA